MAGVKKVSGALLAAAVVAGMAVSVPAQADSTVVTGPGFKVEKQKGWFGRKKTVYTDALGNRVESKTGLFGRKSTKTKLFGSEVTRNGNNMTVVGPNGKPLVTKKRRLFRGEQTQVDGNGIFEAVKDVFNSTP